LKWVEPVDDAIVPAKLAPIGIKGKIVTWIAVSA